MVTSLTRAAAVEISSRVDADRIGAIGTLHSICYRAMGGSTLPVAESLIEDWNTKYPLLAITGDGAKPSDDDIVEAPIYGEDRGDKAYADVMLARSRMLDEALWLPDMRTFRDLWEAWKMDVGAVDFTDMIEYGLGMPTAPGEPSVIVADEVQDYSRLEMAVLRHWAEGAEHTVLIGDPDQALYEWRGADPEIFRDASVDDEHRRVLSQSYRVPRQVRDRALAWIRQHVGPRRNDVVYDPRDEDGEVVRGGACFWQPEGLIAQVQADLDAGRSVMVMATTSRMLQPLVSVLRQQGMPFANPWRRRRGDWNPLYTRKDAVSMADRILAYLRPDKAVWGDEARWWTGDDLRRWTSPLRADGVLRHGAKAAIDKLRGNHHDEMLVTDLIEWFHEEALSAAMDGGLDWWEGALLPLKHRSAKFPLEVARRHGAAMLRKEPKLYVGTVHSFKGAEADAVYVWPDLSVPAWEEWSNGGLAARDAIARVFYVAMTRARQRLVLLPPGGRRAVMW